MRGFFVLGSFTCFATATIPGCIVHYHTLVVYTPRNNKTGKINRKPACYFFYSEGWKIYCLCRYPTGMYKTPGFILKRMLPCNNHH